MGDLLTDAVREAFKCDIVIIQGGAIRGNKGLFISFNILSLNFLFVISICELRFEFEFVCYLNL